MDIEELRALVRRKIFNGYTPVQVFGDLCKSRGPDQKLHSKLYKKEWHGILQLIYRYFKHPSIGITENIPAELRLEVRVICEEFQKSKIALDQKRCSPKRSIGCSMQFISERYALEVEFDNKNYSFFLYDLLWERKRKLQVEDEICFVVRTFNQKIVVFDVQYFLIYHDDYADDYTSTTVMYLLELNLNELRCTVVDKHELVGVYSDWVTDVSNPHMFVCSVIQRPEDRDDPTENYLLQGCILNGKLQFNGTPLPFGRSAYMLFKYPNMAFFQKSKLEGDKMHVFYYNRGKNEEFFICELTLGPDNVRCQQVCTIEVGDYVYLLDYIQNQFSWFRNVFYFSHIHGDGHTTFYKLDLNTRTGSEIEPVNLCGFSVCMRVDDGAMSVCAVNMKNKLHVWQRIALNELGPDKLFCLAMKSVCVQATFMNNEEFRELIQKFPVKLRPFEQTVC